MKRARPGAAARRREPQAAPALASAPDLAEQVAAFVSHCRSRGLSVTHQRLALFEALATSREHPSAEQLHRAVRRRIPTLSLGTVYKNLDVLQSVGAVANVNPLRDQARYESALPGTGVGKPHHHLVCIQCKRVLDVHEATFDALRLPRQEARGFEIRSVHVQVEGVCPSCQAS